MLHPLVISFCSETWLSWFGVLKIWKYVQNKFLGMWQCGRQHLTNWEYNTFYYRITLNLHSLFRFEHKNNHYQYLFQSILTLTIPLNYSNLFSSFIRKFTCLVKISRPIWNENVNEKKWIKIKQLRNLSINVLFMGHI